jgi:hypothetical protein
VTPTADTGRVICHYYGCPYPTNPRYNHDHPEDFKGCARLWRNLDSGHLCECGLPYGHGEACRCGGCGAAATPENLYGPWVPPNDS